MSNRGWDSIILERWGIEVVGHEVLDRQQHVVAFDRFARTFLHLPGLETRPPQSVAGSVAEQKPHLQDLSSQIGMANCLV